MTVAHTRRWWTSVWEDRFDGTVLLVLNTHQLAVFIDTNSETR